MTYSLIISIIVSFLTTFFFTPALIKYFRGIGILSADLHKKKNPLVPNSAGIPTASGIIAGILTFIFVEIFISNNKIYTTDLLAALSSILIICFIGFFDDLNVKQTNSEGYPIGRVGLRRWQKALLVLPAALPLMVIKVGHTTMNLPFLGTIDFGLLYPLILVPIGVLGAANMVNMLDGLNGVATGMGIVYTFSLGIFAFIHGIVSASVLFFATFAALLAIIKFNWSPAKILSGDSLTYVLGAVVATGAIIGNMEKATIITMLPFLIQGVLKFYAMSKLHKVPTDMGILQKDGTIKSKYGNGIYSWTHFIMNIGNFTERQIAMLLIFIQAVFAVIPFLGIF